MQQLLSAKLPGSFSDPLHCTLHIAQHDAHEAAPHALHIGPACANHFPRLAQLSAWQLQYVAVAPLVGELMLPLVLYVLFIEWEWPHPPWCNKKTR